MASLQFQIELGSNGLQISNDDPYKSRQELAGALRRYCNNWLDLSLDTGQAIIRAPNGEQYTLWELRDGLFASAYTETGFHSMQANAVQVIRLDDPTSRWAVTFEDDFHELTIDPSQDLLVLAAVNLINSAMLSLRFCSLTTGLAHPLARRPLLTLQLEFGVTPFWAYSTIALSIVDELLILNLISHNIHEPYVKLLYDVLVIDWHSGTLLNHIGSRRGFCSAGCLDRDRLVVFAADIANWDVNAPGPNSMRLLLYDQIRIPHARGPRQDEAICDVSAHPALSPILRLDFPVFLPEVSVVVIDFLLRPGSTPSHIPLCDSKFITDPFRRTLSLNVRFVTIDGDGWFVIFVDVRKLLCYLSQARSQQFTSLSWDEWGEYSTRWIRPSDPPSPWISWMDGSRFVKTAHAHGPAQPQLVIADFNTAIVRRFSTRESAKYRLFDANEEREVFAEGSWPHITQDPEAHQRGEREMAVYTVEEDLPTIIRNLSTTPIVSRLPYRLTAIVGLSVAYDSWMIDGNRLIGIKVCLVFLLEV
ncbi:hypothetical protein FRC06_008392 [Ceratobasidium sp. 370]|nr:hypothetical protein FRC06_008392 [Ceratobasidium sp. 370]